MRTCWDIQGALILKQIEYKQIVRRRDYEEWAVLVNDKVAFELSFDLWSLLTSTYYVRLTPGDLSLLSPSILRELRRKMQELQGSLICQCALDSSVDQRFAAFFGFAETGRCDNRVHMET